jgi:hypothetical protein
MSAVLQNGQLVARHLLLMMALRQRRPKVLHCLSFRALLGDTLGGTSTDLGFAPGIDVQAPSSMFRMIPTTEAPLYGPIDDESEGWFAAKTFAYDGGMFSGAAMRRCIWRSTCTWHWHTRKPRNEKKWKRRRERQYQRFHGAQHFMHTLRSFETVRCLF